jgi:hypothetical protein
LLLTADVLVTVGPLGELPEPLRECYENILKAVLKYDIRTVVILLDNGRLSVAFLRDFVATLLCALHTLL